MPLGLNRKGGYLHGNPITPATVFGTVIDTTTHNFGNLITASTTFGNPITLPKSFGNPIPPITVAIVSSTNPAAIGASITFTCTVTGNSPTGQAFFYDGASLLSTQTLNGSGIASYSTSSLALGTHTITVIYSGDYENPEGSTSLSQVVGKSDTTTALASSANPSMVGSSVTFTATVTGVVPTGTVTFYDGVSSFGTGTLNGSGIATCATSGLTQATHSITAVYGGDTDNNGSTSPVLSQVVNPSYLWADLVTDLSTPTAWTVNSADPNTVAVSSAQEQTAGITSLKSFNAVASFAYVNTGVALKGHTISFYTYIVDGCPDFYFGTDSGGNACTGLRLDTRSPNTSGLYTASWVGAGGSNTYATISQNAWHLISITISADGTKASWSLDGVAQQTDWATTPANIAGLGIGLCGDGGGGPHYWSQFKVT